MVCRVFADGAVAVQPGVSCMTQHDIVSGLQRSPKRYILGYTSRLSWSGVDDRRAEAGSVHILSTGIDGK